MRVERAPQHPRKSLAARPGGGSLYQIPERWVAVRTGRCMPTSDRESWPGKTGSQKEPSASQKGGGVDRSNYGGQGCRPGAADRGQKNGQDNEENARKKERHAVSERGHCGSARKKGGGTAACQRPAGEPGAASRAKSTTRGPEISSVDGTRFFVHDDRRSDCLSSRDIPYSSLSTFFVF